MISTATTLTVLTVGSAALGGSAALVGIVVLLALLVQKELASTAQGRRWQRLSAALNVGIAPLLAAFAAVVIALVVAALN